MKLVFTVCFSALLLLLSAYSWAAAPAFKDPFSVKDRANQHRSCISSLYVKATEDWVVLKVLPDKDSETLAQLHNRQYLCEMSAEGDWVYVMAVPFADGADTLCKKQDVATSGIDCHEMANFPIKWQPGKEQSTKDCRLVSEPDAEGFMLVTYTTGNCAAGWIHKDKLFYFAD